MSSSAVQDTQTIDRLLHAAEEHFAVHGFFASSLRQITRDAEANVAAVHYHFGSKEALFVAVLNRRIAPFVKSVLDGLHQAKAHSGALQAEDVVDAFVHACFDLIQERHAAALSKLVSRLMLDEYKPFRDRLITEHGELAEQLQAAFAHSLPNLPAETVRWRMHLALSTLFNAFAGNDVVKALAPGAAVNAKDPQQVARYVKPFVVAGLTAPA
ncbi:TetR/AcrR family transcriptional regulator [Snodgrassella sp. CFCC 13594]|uniref:TetR/AcrR family transcriptional regulator n=1 Tax=Snodgrassella sp. CFCC 13594 TaxID=1775559 RepID=UPI0018D3EF24|nr:TetR family transcriptional regulator [Snodgrassella sp. CFCC 13594]